MNMNMNAHTYKFNAALNLTNEIDRFDLSGSKNALIHAVVSKDHEKVLALAKRGAHPNVRGANGWTPLFIAVYQDSLEMVQTVIRAFRDNGDYARFRAGIDLPNSVGHTALACACRRGNARIVRLLLEEHGADPNHRCNMGHTALWGSMFRVQNVRQDADFREVCRLLLAHGADPALFCCPRNRTTPLMNAARSDFVDMVAMLLASDASPPLDVNAQDAKGYTAWSYAVRYNAGADVVEMLLRHGASDPSIAAIAATATDQKLTPANSGAAA